MGANLRANRILPMLIMVGAFGLSGCNIDIFTPDTTQITLCKVAPFFCKNDDYQPKQPIYYSHKVHAGDNEIPCQYCHSGARKSDHAVIPAVSRCMGCHKMITKAVSEDVKRYQPEIDKLLDYHEKGEAIPWVKAHDLPDHVRFSHKPHVANGLECQTCHGPVEEFSTGKKLGWDDNLDQAPLTMGWCVQCHTENGPKVAQRRLEEAGLTPQSEDWDHRLKVETKTVLGNLKNCYTCHK